MNKKVTPNEQKSDAKLSKKCEDELRDTKPDNKYPDVVAVVFVSQSGTLCSGHELLNITVCFKNLTRITYKT